MDIIRIKNLNAGFPTKRGLVRAATSVDLTIREGECLGLIGESGCGKSTLLTVLNRMLEEKGGSFTGEVLFKDKNILSCQIESIRKSI